MTIYCEIPGLPKTGNAQASMHWMAKGKYVRQWHQAIWMATAGKRPREPFQRARLTLTRFSSTQPDFDNLVISWKPVIDGLIKSGIIADDKMSNIGQSEYRWEHAPARRGKIQIIVEEIE